MEWTKLHTSLIVNRVPDKDILAIAKYQLLWAELEREPDEATALRYMTANQLALARQYHADIMADVSQDIESTCKSRKRRRKFYLKNKENLQNVTVTQTHTQTHTQTGTRTHVDKIREDMLSKDNNKRPTAQVSAGSVQKPKQLNDLQKFAVAVAERFEEPMDKVQLGIWYKRNCRCLTDILNFCGKNIPLGLETISVCVRRLEKAGLSGGYEAVARNLPEYLAQAKKQMEVINAGN